MGYYTDFSLNVYDKDKNEVTPRSPVWLEISKVLDKIMGETEGYDFLSEVYNITSQKWYSYDIDMTELAKTFPDYYFMLEGQGEERDDWWVAVYHGDKRRITSATPPDRTIEV